MKLIVAVSSKRDACMSFSTLDCHEECFHVAKVVYFPYISKIKYVYFPSYVLQHIFQAEHNSLTL